MECEAKIVLSQQLIEFTENDFFVIQTSWRAVLIELTSFLRMENVPLKALSDAQWVVQTR